MDINFQHFENFLLLPSGFHYFIYLILFCILFILLNQFYFRFYLCYSIINIFIVLFYLKTLSFYLNFILFYLCLRWQLSIQYSSFGINVPFFLWSLLWFSHHLWFSSILSGVIFLRFTLFLEFLSIWKIVSQGLSIYWVYTTLFYSSKRNLFTWAIKLLPVSFTLSSIFSSPFFSLYISFWKFLQIYLSIQWFSLSR